MSIERDLLARVLTSELWSVQEELQAEIKQLLSQPEQDQEPVAWMYEWVNEIGEPVKSIVYNFYEDSNLIPLYTSPPKREPLSDEAVGELLMGGFSTHLMDLVRAVEKAHGIGVYNE